MAQPTSKVKHAFVSGKADGGDNTLVRPSNWNADHTIIKDAFPGDWIQIPSADFPTIASFLDWLETTDATWAPTSPGQDSLWVELDGVFDWPNQRPATTSPLSRHVSLTGVWKDVTFTGSVVGGSLGAATKTMAITDAAAVAGGLYVEGQLLRWWGDGVNYPFLDGHVCRVSSIVGNVTTLVFLTQTAIANGSVAGAYCDIRATIRQDASGQEGSANPHFSYYDNLAFDNYKFTGYGPFASWMNNIANVTLYGLEYYWDGTRGATTTQAASACQPTALCIRERYTCITTNQNLYGTHGEAKIKSEVDNGEYHSAYSLPGFFGFGSPDAMFLYMENMKVVVAGAKIALNDLNVNTLYNIKTVANRVGAAYSAFQLGGVDVVANTVTDRGNGSNWVQSSNS